MLLELALRVPEAGSTVTDESARRTHRGGPSKGADA